MLILRKEKYFISFILMQKNGDIIFFWVEAANACLTALNNVSN